MAYNTIFARSFSRHEQKKMGCAAFACCLIVALCFLTLFKPYLGPLPVLNLRLSVGVGLRMLISTGERSFVQKLDANIKEAKAICDTTGGRSDVCEMNGDIRIHGNTSTIFIASTKTDIFVGNSSSWSIKPYARKGDKVAMDNVRELIIKTPSVLSQDHSVPRCTQNHSIPAIVFSIGGYAGNHFHAFSDVVIPLYLTSRDFKGEVQFLIADMRSSLWTSKFRVILENLSKYRIIDIDQDNGVHCFPSMTVGLKHHKELNIDPSKSQYSMKDFRQFLRKSYSLKREKAVRLTEGESKRPRLLIITRKRTRSFMNEGEIGRMAKSLGCDVIVTEADSNITRFARVVNSCDVIVGVHGAGLTNIVFLPDNAVLIQVVPLGGMEWLSRTDFGDPTKNMNISYLEYMISKVESSLIQKYPLDHEVIKDPYFIQKKGWGTFRSVYLDDQNVKLDVVRFRATLLEALQLLRCR